MSARLPFLFLSISKGKVVLPSPKIVLNLPGTYKKLPCKGEADRLARSFGIDILLLYYKDRQPLKTLTLLFIGTSGSADSFKIVNTAGWLQKNKKQIAN